MRDELIDTLQREVIGPDPNENYRDPETGEELLLEKVHGAPWVRYGAGMLYPQGAGFEKEPESDSRQPESTEQTEDLENLSAGNAGAGGNTGGDETEESIGMAYQYKPSAMGFTASFSSADPSAVLHILIRSAWYEKIKKQELPEKIRTESGEVQDKFTKSGVPILREYWVRRKIAPENPVVLQIGNLLNRGNVYEELVPAPGNDGDWLKLRIFNRTTVQDEEREAITLTFTLINCRQYKDSLTSQDTNGDILYQNELIVKTAPGVIQPYREKFSTADTEEEEELRLLYRRKRVYGIGHGCSAEWTADADGNVAHISSSFLPVYEIPPVDPTAYVELAMFELSDLGDWNQAKESLNRLVREYGIWVKKQEEDAELMADELYRLAAVRNAKKCRETLRRISDGVELLTGAQETDKNVQCFRWMNRAMLWQQQRSKTTQRKWTTQKTTVSLADLPSNRKQHESLQEFHDSSTPENPRGRWRPFQLAFVLMNLSGIWDETSGEREMVDLIWFPTGGGKTEAYLGLTAFTIFARRMRGNVNRNFALYSGTAILMRYTLRLLTTQQYERAASLVCACELIRLENRLLLGPDTIGPDRVSNRISIGLWVGLETTPNKRKDAVADFNKLSGKSKSRQAPEYNFIVMKCPCCGAQIGLIDTPTATEKIKGIHRTDGTDAVIYFQCDNVNCEFSVPERSLPMYVVDDDIFACSPTVLLGTVDKFAQINWKRDAGTIFGFRGDSDDNMSRITPPELIIQDELHLISGPLGTVVGLYETLIQTLCNDYRKSTAPFFPQSADDFVRPPKIIASSATISRAAEQVKALYAADQLTIFPSQGLEFGDTWFSREKQVDAENPGRRYIGVLAPGYQSGQTTVVRTYAPVLQKLKSGVFSDRQKDFYWTLLGFFNSIRELGMASSLVFADIYDYLRVVQNRSLVTTSERRKLRRVKELTSRINSSQIPRNLKELEESYHGADFEAIDVCLATNMIATGLDVSRLGLMYIHGQPKTTAEYIQASSRVGRTKEGPGLVVMIYSPSKPRDKSVYEQFQAYHSRIYAHVEPTSVTPFSIDARERALHAVIIGLMRHFSQDNLRSRPLLNITGNSGHAELFKWIEGIIRKRVDDIDPGESAYTIEQSERILRDWQKGFEHYGDMYNSKIREGLIPLMHAANSQILGKNLGASMLTPTSMRGVDEEAVISILNAN
jgi:hypothetical protein